MTSPVQQPSLGRRIGPERDMRRRRYNAFRRIGVDS